MNLILVMLNDLNENFHANVGNGNGFLWESQIPNKFPKKFSLPNCGGIIIENIKKWSCVLGLGVRLRF